MSEQTVPDRSQPVQVTRLTAGLQTMSLGVSPTVTWTSEWTSVAACKTTDPDELFVQGAAQNRVKTICVSCSVRTECLADALDNNIEFGVWGGMTERERRALLRRRPHVTSWRQLLETARSEYDVTITDLTELDLRASRAG